jgi:hypothetical protein
MSVSTVMFGETGRQVAGAPRRARIGFAVRPEAASAPPGRASHRPCKGLTLMSKTLSLEDQDVLLSIQNSKNPAQQILLVIDESREYLQTQGLRTLFGVKEIRLSTQQVVQDLQEYAQVLTFILDTIATADELGLPYSYQNEFQFGNANYSLYEEGDFRLLKKVEG